MVDELRVSSRAANTNGCVFIVEYHKLANEESRWDRSRKRFGQDLQRLYDLGFRPVTLTSYLLNEMKLPHGASPIVFTLDDSHPSQLRLLDSGEVDPECFVGIWRSFSQKHPDFPVVATFYVIPPNPWGQKGTLSKKLSLLKSWGCEIGSHTFTHANLGKTDSATAKQELAKSIDFIQSQGFEANSIALPYGISPKDPAILRGFQLGDKHYRFKCALLVGAPGVTQAQPLSTAANTSR